MTGLRGRCSIGCLGIVVFICGCGGSDQAAIERQGSNIKSLAIIYSRYTSRNRGNPPANEKVFKEYIRSMPEETRKRFDAEDVDALFISPRDNKPYIVFYGNTGGRQTDVIAYEQEGVGGRRWVARDLGIVEEVDEARLKELIPDHSSRTN